MHTLSPILCPNTVSKHQKKVLTDLPFWKGYRDGIRRFINVLFNPWALRSIIVLINFMLTTTSHINRWSGTKSWSDYDLKHFKFSVILQYINRSWISDVTIDIFHCIINFGKKSLGLFKKHFRWGRERGGSLKSEQKRTGGGGPKCVYVRSF